MPFTAKSLISLRSWLFYAELVAVIGFIGLAFFYIQRGTAESESPPLSQVGAFIQQADTLYKKQDLADAALYYWQALHALQTEDKVRDIPINGTSQTSAAVRLHANLRIAEIYSQSNWLKDAKARLEYAARIQPEHAGVRLLRGKLFRDEGVARGSHRGIPGCTQG